MNHTVVPQLPQLLSRECFFYLLSVEQLTTHNPLLTKLTLNCKLLGNTMHEFYFEVDFLFKAQMVKWWHVQTPRGSCRIKHFWLVNFSTLWVICAEQHALENPHTFYGLTLATKILFLISCMTLNVFYYALLIIFFSGCI